MYRTACPSCGAEVVFRSTASVLAVCEYCRSTLLRDADSVRNIGKMAALLEDYSPLQIGSSGVWQGRAFTLVGRLQLRFEAGAWNEWHALFDDGASGWLSDASGQYVLTRPAALPATDLPLFERLAPGNTLRFAGAGFVAADIRSARCSAAEGELPFPLGPQWLARVADYRCGERFLTLDWSDGATPAAYLGSAVTLEALRCQLLREPDQILASAGKLPGSRSTLACPTCGAGIDTLTGLTPHLACPACHSEITLAAGQAEVLARHDELAAVDTTLALGDEARIDGQAWRIIGLARWLELGEDSEGEWTEYLLHHPTQGFRWLVETAEGWQDARVLDRWPEPFDARIARLDDKPYARRYDYTARASYVAGAFNWRLRVGDQVQLREYGSDSGSLTMELGEHEMGWSFAQAVGEDEVMRRFGRKPAAGARRPRQAAPTVPTGSFGGLAKIFSILLIVLNLPTLWSEDGSTLLVIAGLVALWAPVWKGAIEE